MNKYFVVATEVKDKETNAEVTMFVKEGFDDSAWFTTLNIGEAFMFFDKNVARDVAKELSETLEQNEDFLVNSIAILAVSLEIEESEVVYNAN